jgi:hypothetical protein
MVWSISFLFLLAMSGFIDGLKSGQKRESSGSLEREMCRSVIDI